jgi:hypothetical protein
LREVAQAIDLVQEPLVNQEHLTDDFLVDVCGVVLSAPQIFDSQASFSNEQNASSGHPGPHKFELLTAMAMSTV